VSGAPRRALACAAEVLRRGGIVAHPTEGVYGLGVVPGEARAVARLERLKARDAGKGFILIGARVEILAQLTTIDEAVVATRLSGADRERATTWVVPAHDAVPEHLIGPGRTVALRLTRHPIARALCEMLGSALISTSANRTGQPPARTAPEVEAAFGSSIDFVVRGACGGEDGPSRVMELTTGKVLRE